jgi:hypothetical protein
MPDSAHKQEKGLLTCGEEETGRFYISSQHVALQMSCHQRTRGNGIEGTISQHTASGSNNLLREHQ